MYIKIKGVYNIVGGINKYGDLFDPSIPKI